VPQQSIHTQISFSAQFTVGKDSCWLEKVRKDGSIHDTRSDYVLCVVYQQNPAKPKVYMIECVAISLPNIFLSRIV
jgi:hypothetical protein